MSGTFWLTAMTAGLFLAACSPPAPANQETTVKLEEGPDTVPPADVSHGEAPIGGPQADPAPVAAQLAPAERIRLHRIRLEMSHTPVNIAPDLRYAAWTFGGTVPGPALHVRQGDTVAFTLVNRANIPHSMDSMPRRLHPASTTST